MQREDAKPERLRHHQNTAGAPYSTRQNAVSTHQQLVSLLGLREDGPQVKAHYRKAQSLERLGRFDDALAAIAKGREVKDDPSFATLEKQVPGRLI